MVLSRVQSQRVHKCIDNMYVECIGNVLSRVEHMLHGLLFEVISDYIDKLDTDELICALMISRKLIYIKLAYIMLSARWQYFNN